MVFNAGFVDSCRVAHFVVSGEAILSLGSWILEAECIIDWKCFCNCTRDDGQILN